jgi:hypothetical protein
MWRADGRDFLIQRCGECWLAGGFERLGNASDRSIECARRTASNAASNAASRVRVPLIFASSGNMWRFGARLTASLSTAIAICAFYIEGMAQHRTMYLVVSELIEARRVLCLAERIAFQAWPVYPGGYFDCLPRFDR